MLVPEEPELPHRRIEHILVLAMIGGACGGAALGLLYMVWAAVLAGSAAGAGGWTVLAMMVGAVIGVSVALPTGVVWILVAQPEREALTGARWGVALAAAATAGAVSLVVLHSMNGFAYVCAAAAATCADHGGPLLGSWRSTP